MHTETATGHGTTAAPQPHTGRIGPYEVFQLLGEGGMGQVFLARSPGSRLVALKVIRPEYTDTPGFRGRFRREVDAARKVSGFYTPAVLDADADAQQPWLATAYVPAPSLHDVVRRFGTLPEPALRALGTGLAEALLAIHAAGLVHRDLKPGNVLVTDDGARVIDFGISRALDATQLTRTDDVIGTPGFMAPEQITSSRETGPAADVFSLGCVLVFAATGRGPFGAGGAAEVLYRAVHAPPRLDGVPDALRPLIAACLAKSPAGRPPVTALPAALGDTDPSALLTTGLREDLAVREAHAAVMVAAPPVPDTAPETGGAGGPSRRRFLWIAVAGGTAAAATGIPATARWASKPERAKGRGAGAGTAVRPGAKPIAGPAPQWSRPFQRLQGGHLRLLGDTLVHWDQSDAVGYDTETGKKRWTASPRMPSDVSGEPRWLGVQGSTLYAAASGDRGHLLGLDGDGALKFSHAVTDPEEGSSSPDSLQHIFCDAGSVAVVGSDGERGFRVRAVDLRTGRVLWSREMSGSDYRAYSDGHTCFLQDGGSIHGMDLRTGTVHWTVRNLFTPGTYPNLSTDGKALLVTSVKVQAFRTTDGRSRWTAVSEPTSLSPTTVLGGRAYLADSQDTVFALDTRNGKQLWHTASPLSLDPGNALDPGPCVSSSLVVLPLFGAATPGFVVLRASDGKLLWAHQGSGAKASAQAKETWLVQVAGTTIYAASDTTLYSFRSDTP